MGLATCLVLLLWVGVLGVVLAFGRRTAAKERVRRRSGAWQGFARTRGFVAAADGRMVRSLRFGECILEQLNPAATRFDDFQVRVVARPALPSHLPPTRFGLAELQGTLRDQARAFFGEDVVGIWDGTELRLDVQVHDRLRRIDAAVSASEVWLECIRQRNERCTYR